jgi:hypothetical protein
LSQKVSVFGVQATRAWKATFRSTWRTRSSSSASLSQRVSCGMCVVKVELTNRNRRPVAGWIGAIGCSAEGKFRPGWGFAP